jgi:hypothetical protein
MTVAEDQTRSATEVSSSLDQRFGVQLSKIGLNVKLTWTETSLYHNTVFIDLVFGDRPFSPNTESCHCEVVSWDKL